jgi:hypothetical protein
MHVQAARPLFGMLLAGQVAQLAGHAGHRLADLARDDVRGDPDRWLEVVGEGIRP